MNEKKVDSVRGQQRPQSSLPLIDFKQLWALIVINWHWFVVSVFTCVIIAGLFLWLTPTKVSVTGKMEVIDKSNKNSSLSAGMAMLNNLPMGLGSALGGSLGGGLAIDSEKEIITSNSLACNVIKGLGLYTEYYLSEWGRKTLLYNDQPVIVSLDSAHVEWFDRELPQNVHQIKMIIIKNDEGYKVETILKEKKVKTDELPIQTIKSLPATIKTDVGTLTISENTVLTQKQANLYSKGYTLKVEINPPMEAAEDFVKRLSVDPPSKKVSNMLNITLVDENVMRGIDFVNRLVDAYNQRANDDKNEEARKTDEYVNARLAKVDAELGSSDAAWENSKKDFQITTPEVDAEEALTKKGVYEAQLVEIGTQLQLHDYLNEYVNDPANLYEIIPLSIGASSISAKGDNSAVATQSASLIAQHNAFVSQRRDFLKSMSEKAPQVQRLTESIQELHPVIKTAMKRDRQSILMKRSNVEREYSRYASRIGTAPKMERVLTEIGRQREIKQGVYLVMLQKREEIAMELANVTDKGKFFEPATLVKDSKNPKKKVVMLVALFLGLLLPIGILYLICIFKTKIELPQDLKSVSKLPLIGEVPLVEHVEAIRNLRTNLLLGLKEEQKVILVASETKDDGKTFIAHKLAESLLQIGKKAICLDFDLRGGESGISSYLPELKNLHPADLFAREEFANLMKQLKSQYDYLIIDTPSLNKYADAYQIAKFADATCFVVKAGCTSKCTVQKLNNEERLPSIKFVLNAIDMKKKKYRYYFKHAMAILAAMFVISSCGSSEKVAYLQNSDQVNIESSKVLFDARIMPKDLLTITVSTVNPEAAVPFNLITQTAMSQESKTLASQPTLQSYLVSNDGTIDFPIIGSIKVCGLTKKECESMILEKIRPYMADSEKPIVTVRMSSYSISVLGEVKMPGSFPVSREKINIFEALALAGDMTIYGVRDRVRLIREDVVGKKEIHVLDLTDANIINSPYYYLQQNDIIYVEPSKVKKQDARVGSMTNLWFSATSILVSLASIIVTIAK